MKGKSIFDKHLKGVKVPHFKNTEDCATRVIPVPDKVYIGMSQHMGPPCDVKVSVNDKVKVGQLIGDSDKFLSAPIHSSVSGTVVNIDEIIMSNGSRTKAVVIESDKLQELDESIRPPVVNSREDFLGAVRDSGVVGLGGAGFPAHIKLNPKNLNEVDTLIINAAECEPYITSDYRAIMEDGQKIISGIRAMMKWLEITNCFIGVEANKPKGIQKLEELARPYPEIQVVTLKSKYPQGAEKVIIFEIAGRVVPEGKLPADAGVIVSNVTTTASIAFYLETGIPLVNKRITVDGGAVKEPANLLVPLGTPVKDIAAFCGGYSKEPKKILMGGPMMGIAIYDEGYPLLKNNNAILFFDDGQVPDWEETACILCGRCVRACPFDLMPASIERSFLRRDADALQELKVNLCMECGCCANQCPARRDLVQVNRLSKQMLRRQAG